MRLKNTNEQEVKLVMWDKTLMPESTMSKDNSGKTVFTKTGKELEYTTYTFRDSFGEKLVLISKDNSYRNLEGENVIITLSVNFNDFSKKNSVKLVDVTRV